jgi:hypothetical protein
MFIRDFTIGTMQLVAFRGEHCFYLSLVHQHFSMTYTIFPLLSALRVKRVDEDVDSDDTEVATLLQKKGEGEPNHDLLFLLNMHLLNTLSILIHLASALVQN